MKEQPKNYIPEDILDEAFDDPRSAFGIMAENYLRYGETNPNTKNPNIDTESASMTIKRIVDRTGKADLFAQDPRIEATYREANARGFDMQEGQYYDLKGK